MRRKLTRLLSIKTPAKSGGFTLTEVVIASSLLIIAMVPILKALTSAHVTSAIIERKTRSQTLVQAKLDEIKARSVYHYSDTYAETNSSLEGSYLCNVADSSVNAVIFLVLKFAPIRLPRIFPCRMTPCRRLRLRSPNLPRKG